MSELVERYLEHLLPVFENLERLKLFTREEIRLTVAKLKSHEYRIQRFAKRKEDLIAYIQYLLCFSRLVAKRRRVTGIDASKDEINRTLNNKIEYIFRIACRRYPNDESIWLSRIEYARRRGMTALVGDHYNRMLKLHPKKPHLWIAAAKWQMEKNMSVQNARTLLHSGVRFNRKCAKLWIELLKFELLNVEKVLKRRDVFLEREPEGVTHEANDEPIDLKLPSIVFRHAVKAIEGDRSFCCRLLELVQSFPFAKKLVDEMERYMDDRFANDEKQIDHIIRRDCWRSKRFGLEVVGGGMMENSLCVETFNVCCLRYMSAIESSPSYEMRHLYINFCHNVFRLPTSDASLREQCYLRLFFGYAMTYATCLCDAGFFIDWANICPNLRCKVIVLQAGLRRFPKEVELWLFLLKCQWDAQMDESEIAASIARAKQLVPPENALPIWKKSIALYRKLCPAKLLEEFKAGVHLQASVSNYVKREYLRFIYETKGIQRARKLYHQKLCVVSPASLQLHYDYVDIEMEQKPPCADQIRKSYEKAVVDHGCGIKIWLDYLLFEATIGSAVRCSQIHHRAVRSLPPELVQAFLEANVLREDKMSSTTRRLKSDH